MWGLIFFYEEARDTSFENGGVFVLQRERQAVSKVVAAAVAVARIDANGCQFFNPC